MFLARQGLSVDALDVSPLAVARLNDYARAQGLALTARVADLVESGLPTATYDLVVVVRFLERSLCPAIAAALRPGGLLFYQTFTRERTGPGPSNPDFLLAPGELARLFGELRTVYYREDGLLGDTRVGLRGEALLVARAPAA